MATTLPGTYGLPLIGETPSLLYNLQTFLQTRIRLYGTLFRTHLLRLPTIISCSYHSTLEILRQPAALSAPAAYAEFMGSVYPVPNLMLSTPTAAAHKITTDLFLPALSASSLEMYKSLVGRLTEQSISALQNTPEPTIRPYAFFKPLTSQITINTILGHLPPPMQARIRALASDHFNAVLSAPLALDLLGRRTARARGQAGYSGLVALLTELVDSRLATPLPEPTCVLDTILAQLPGASTPSDKRSHLVHFLLLLLSPAIPKSLASALASFVRIFRSNGGRALAERVRESERACGHVLDHVLMEVLRLHPPLLGGMRLTDDDGRAVISGHSVSGRCRVWYSIRDSNRDEGAYDAADEFREGRWSGAEVTDAPPSGCPFGRPGEIRAEACPTAMSFGAGERHCPGRDVAWMVLRVAARRFLEAFDVVEDGADEAPLRFLPVLREENEKEVRLVARREDEEGER